MSQDNVAQRSLFSLSWPIFIDVFLHFSTLLINTYMVSHVSSSWLAAMGAGNQIFDLCITIFSFISVGCTVVIAQYLGAGNREMAKKALHISIAFNLLVGLICALLTVFFGYKVLELMNMPEHLVDDAFAYLSILGLCLVPEAVSLILAACLRVNGKTKSAMIVTLLANLITVLGNMLVLYGFFGLPQLGLAGVAWSTLIGRVFAVVLLIGLLFYGLRIRFELKEFLFWSKDTLKKILHIGLPAAGENVVWMSHYIVAFAFIGLIGESSLAGQTLYFQIALFIMLFGISIGIGNEIQVGHLVGAKLFEAAYRQTFHSLKLGVGVTVLVVAVFWLLKEQILSTLSDDKEIAELLIPLFFLALILEPVRCINIVLVNALRATGDARFPLYISMCFMWGLALPVGYFLGVKMEMGLLGIWMGFFCDELVRGVIYIWRWKSRKWQEKRLDIQEISA